jgi:hypothetical protein
LEDGTTLYLSSDKPGVKSKGSNNSAPSAGADPSRKKKKKAAANKKQKNSDEVCLKFQRGACSDPCPHGRRHVHQDQGKSGDGGKQDKGKGGGKGSKGQ